MKRFIITSSIIFSLLYFNTALYSFSDTESLFEQATEALNSGNYGSSELLFKKVIDSDDDEFRDKAQFYHAKSIFFQKKYKSAIYEFNSYLNSCRTPALCIESRFWIGESYYNLDEYDKAIEEYKRYIQKSRKNSMSASAHDRIALIYYNKKRYDEAVIEWTRAIGTSDDREKNATRVVQTGEALFLSKKYDEALKRLSPILTSNSRPGTIAMARIISGRVLQLKENHNKALILFNGVPEDLLKINPYSDVHYFKALSYIETGRQNIAKNQLNLFTHIAPKSEWYYDALYELGKINMETREEEKGIKLLKEVYEKTEKNQLKIKASIILTGLLIEKNPSDAILYLKESLRAGDIDERNKLLLLLGRAYISTKQFNEAEKILTEYIDKYPFDANIDEVNFLMARIQLEKGNEDRAMDLLKKLQEENPFSKFLNESNYYLALVNYRKENYNKAVILLKKYLYSKDTVNKYDANILLLNSYIKLNYFNSASSIIKNFIRNYSSRKDVEKYIYSYAIAAQEKGLKSDYYFNFIIKKYPESESAFSVFLFYANRAFLKKDYKEAAKYYTQYLKGKSDRDRGLAYYNRLISLYKLADYEQVISIIRKGGMPPMEEEKWKEIPLFLSRSYFNLGNYTRVYQIMYSEDFGIYKPSDLILFVKSSLEVNDPDSANLAGDKLKDNRKFYAEYLLSIGDYYRKKKYSDKSIGYYLKVTAHYSDTESADKAAMMLAETYYEREQYAKTIEYLNNIKNKDLDEKKIYLFVRTFFSMNDPAKGTSYTQRNLRIVLKSNYSEEILKLNLEYYLKQKNYRMFNTYAYYLKKKAGTEAYLNLRYADFYILLKNYKKAYYYLYRLSVMNSKYRQQAYYDLARINQFIYRSKKNAAVYYKKAAETEDGATRIKMDSLFNMAIISIETRNSDKAREILKKIMHENTGGIYYYRARNLLLHYGLLPIIYSERKGI